MKKLISLVLVAALMLSLSSCAFLEAATAYGLYSKAMKTIEKAGGYEADCTMTMVMNLLGEELEMAYDMNVKQNGENMQMFMDIEGVSTEMVMVDNTVYISAEDQKIKYSVTSEEQSEEIADSMGTANLPDLTEDFFENIDVIESEDGTKTITLALDNETAKEIMGIVNEQSDELGGTVELENIFLTMKFTEKNVLDLMTLDCDMAVSTMGIEMEVGMSIEYKFVNLGTAPEIVVPEDADSYTDGGEYPGNM
ncbi:MAG: hypothetical protein IJ424_06025 [Oscillospiraceae bacterium]|nr:hypothetical protein [Oscillospiraceae bacterium]